MKDWKTIALILLSIALTICLFIIFSGSGSEIDREKYNELEQENKELTVKNDSLLLENVKQDSIIAEKDSLLKINQEALDSNKVLIDDLVDKLDNVEGEVKEMSDDEVVDYLKNYLSK